MNIEARDSVMTYYTLPPHHVFGIYEVLRQQTLVVAGIRRRRIRRDRLAPGILIIAPGGV